MTRAELLTFLFAGWAGLAVMVVGLILDGTIG